MRTKYSIFISSTYEDLRSERRAVQDTVIKTGDFPVQMESFPAADEGPFDLITSLLDECDYYILIIGGRYGKPGPDGLSYTHKEYRYATEREIPVLVMLHGDRGQISADKTENTDEGKALLESFIAEVSGRHRKTWTTIGELQHEVLQALIHAKQTRPRVGWVRGDTAAAIETLAELNEVRKEKDKYREALGQLEVEIPAVQLPAIESRVEVDFLPNQPIRSKLRGSSGTISTTWMPLFPIIFQNLSWEIENFGNGYYIDAERSCIGIGSALVQEVSEIDTSSFFKISQNTLRRLTSYFIEINLMNPEGDEHPFPEVAQRIARRQQFALSDRPNFVLKHGTIELFLVSSSSSSDHIPF
jgi:hypothetical protein